MCNLPAELAAVLEGRDVISKLEQNISPIFRKNLAPWTAHQEAHEALWPEVAKCCGVAKMLWRGTFEDIERSMRMPLAIMAVRAVPKPTNPFFVVSFVVF